MGDLTWSIPQEPARQHANERVDDARQTDKSASMRHKLPHPTGRIRDNAQEKSRGPHNNRLAITLLFSEIFSLSAGGMIVPGYFALALDNPLAVCLTVLVALATWGIVKGISQFTILYGRRRVVLMVLLGFILGQSLQLLVAPAPAAMPIAPIIGMIIPGLIALWIERQGIVETLSVLCLCSVLVRLTLILVGVEVTA